MAILWCRVEKGIHELTDCILGSRLKRSCHVVFLWVLDVIEEEERF